MQRSTKVDWLMQWFFRTKICFECGVTSPKMIWWSASRLSEVTFESWLDRVVKNYGGKLLEVIIHIKTRDKKLFSTCVKFFFFLEVQGVPTSRSKSIYNSDKSQTLHYTGFLLTWKNRGVRSKKSGNIKYRFLLLWTHCFKPSFCYTGHFLCNKMYLKQMATLATGTSGFKFPFF